MLGGMGTTTTPVAAMALANDGTVPGRRVDDRMRQSRQEVVQTLVQVAHREADDRKRQPVCLLRPRECGTLRVGVNEQGPSPRCQGGREVHRGDRLAGATLEVDDCDTHEVNLLRSAEGSTP